MNSYLKFEILRTIRNRQGYIFSLIFPVVMFLVFGVPQRNSTAFPVNISPITYYMVGLLGFGAMGAVISGGARIAIDRATGWNRQLRLSPLRSPMYIAAKVVIGYVSALLTIALMYIAGISFGAHASLVHWIEMTLLILIGLAPFAAIGIWVGHIAKEDAMGPIMGGLMSLFALLGGSYYPLGDGILGKIGSWIPSYWIVQAGHVAVGAGTWPAKGWAVVLVWAVAFTALAGKAYRADTRRAR